MITRSKLYTSLRHFSSTLLNRLFKLAYADDIIKTVIQHRIGT